MQIRAPIFLGIAALSLSATTAFAAGQNANVVVSATVTKECRFKTLTPVPALGFGPVGGNATSNATATTTLQYLCSKNMPFTLAIGTTSMTGTVTSLPRTMLLSGSTTVTLPYSLSWTGLPTSLIGTGFAASATALNLTLNATITQANLQDAIPGDYSDTVVVTLNPV